MIENEIVLLPTREVKPRSSRQRQALNQDKIKEYAASIAARGLIHTVLVNKLTGEIIAGEHRLEAFRYNEASGVPCQHDYQGWTKIPTRLAFDVSEDEVEALELEENIKRHDLTWQEECQAVLRFHKLKQRQDESWAMLNTAAALSLSSASASRCIILAKELESGNERVAKSATMTGAYNIVSRAHERALASEINQLTDVMQEEPESLTKEEVQAVVRGEPIVVQVPTAAPSIRQETILHTDFRQFLSTYAGPKFNMLHCDFPYGVNHQKSEQGKVAEWKAYDDRPEVFWELTELTFKNISKILYPSAHIMFWFSMNYYSEIISRITEWTGGKVDIDPFPLIWHKTDNKGLLPDPSRGPRRVYETALMMSLGDRKIVQAVSNTYGAPATKEGHVSEKPEPVLRHFFRMFVDEFTEILDPTCGSGTAIRAAESLGAKRTLALELDEENVAFARGALERSRILREMSKGVV